VLSHGDRVLFGSHHYFVFCDPTIDPEAMVEWEEAMKEANKEHMSMGGSGAENEEIQRQLKEMEEKLQREKEAKEKEIEE
jgi:hypothetical protein